MDIVNKFFSNKTPSQILIRYNTFIFFCFFFPKLKRFIKQIDLSQNLKYSIILYFSKYVPYLKNKIDVEISSFSQKIKNDLDKKIIDIPRINKIPTFTNQDEIIGMMNELKSRDFSKKKLSGTYYHEIKEIDSFVSRIYPIFQRTNPLHPDIFPSIMKMERDIITMTINLFNGDIKKCFGSLTTGGTESILLACKAYRDFYKYHSPEVIISTTAHAAFDKAAEYLGLNLVKLEPNKETRKLDINEVRRNINRNTIFIVTSAPSFSHGIIDPIKDLSKLAKKNKIGLHVDCCLGGFILPFLENIEAFDFRLDGVTSISADFHKYGLTPKGSSIIMYNNKELAHSQYYVNPEWSGGIYATSNMTGSRCGNIVAITWATLLFVGYNKYKAIALKITNSLNYLIENIESNALLSNYLFVFGKPQVNVIALGSKKADIFLISDKMEEKGWKLNNLQNPNSIHLCLTQIHCDKSVLDEFINNLIDVITQIKDLPIGENISSGIYGSSQKINNRSLISLISKEYLDCLYK
jgi:sphinganine-1-phosphate aldolase